MKNIIFIVFVAFLLFGCSHSGNHSHTAPTDDAHATNEGSHETESLTLYSEYFEVFTEFDLLREGQEASFLIHITQLNEDYSAFKDGSVTVSLIINNRVQYGSASPEHVDGIFNLKLTPEKSGVGSLEFEIQSDSGTEKLSTDHVHVYKKGITDIHHHGSGEAGIIKFTKEQAWNSRFNVKQLNPDSFSQVIRTSGEFLAMPGEKQNVIAKSQGIVLFASRNLVQGKFVNKGEVLFTLSGQGLADNNIMIRFNEAKINYEISKGNLKRQETLLEEKIISEKQYLQTKGKFTSDSILYYSLKETVSIEGMEIHAPRGGYIHELNVSEGQYVAPGMLMATISSNKVILLRADVPQQYFNELGKITTTHFRPAYTSRVYTLEELSGTLIARGASVAENNHYMPVYFEVVNDGTILEGAFAEFYLKTKPEPGHIVVPVSSLIEDQNNFYVYVQISGEEFQKRAVLLNSSDGINASVASGLSFGERVVSEGPMLIKMATAGGIPSHNHQH